MMFAPPLESRRVLVTEENDGPAANIVAWVLLVTVVLSLFTRLMIQRFHRGGLPNSQDYAVIFATVLDIIIVVMTYQAVKYGLGVRDKSTLSEGNLVTLQMYLYATEMLYFPLLLFTKYACLELLRRIGSMWEDFHATCIATMVLSLLWALAGTLTTGLQCGSAYVWDAEPGQCINMVAFWAAMGALNILTELFIMILPVWLVWSLQLKPAAKGVVVFAFAFRASVVGTDIGRIAQLSLNQSSDMPPGLLGQDTIAQVLLLLVVGCAIVSACTPILKPFLDAFDSGLMGVAMTESFDLTMLSTYYKVPTNDSANEQRGRRRWRIGSTLNSSHETRPLTERQPQRPPTAVGAIDFAIMPSGQSTLPTTPSGEGPPSAFSSSHTYKGVDPEELRSFRSMSGR